MTWGWVDAFDMALNNIAWRNITKLIIHISDAPANGSERCEKNNYNDENQLYPLIKRCVDREIKIIDFQIRSSPKASYEKFKKLYEENEGLLSKIWNFSGINSSQISSYLQR